MYYDFFIAYASADASTATQLFDCLKALGANCFLAERSLRLGDDWDKALSAAQHTSRVTVVVVSPHTDRAFYEREEIAAALALSRSNPEAHRVVPVYLGSTPETVIPYGLRIKHGLFINEDAPIADACRRLVDTLPSALGATETTKNHLSYDVDLCVCIDLSNSLQWLVKLARRQLLTLGHDISLRMLELGKRVDRFRISIITFGADAAHVTRAPMIELPAGAALHYQLVSRLHIAGSGFFQSRGLDALSLAIGSDWSYRGTKNRHVIVVWTDRETARTVPLDELTDRWETEMDPGVKRLVLFAPDRPEWSTISSQWTCCIHFPVSAEGGFTEIEYDTVVNAICHSI